MIQSQTGICICELMLGLWRGVSALEDVSAAAHNIFALLEHFGDVLRRSLLGGDCKGPMTHYLGLLSLRLIHKGVGH